MLNPEEHKELFDLLKKELSVNFPEHAVMGLSKNGDAFLCVNGGMHFLLALLTAGAASNPDFKQAIKMVASSIDNPIDDGLNRLLKILVLKKEEMESAQNPKKDNSEIIKQWKNDRARNN